MTREFSPKSRRAIGPGGAWNEGQRAREAEIEVSRTVICPAGPQNEGRRARLWRKRRGESSAERAVGEGGRREGAEGNGAKAEKPEDSEAAVPCE